MSHGMDDAPCCCPGQDEHATRGKSMEGTGSVAPVWTEQFTSPDEYAAYHGGQSLMERKHLVFVYGTLRNGHSNHHLLKEADCIGTGCTEACYAMYLIRGYPYVTSSEARYPIVGELYALDDETLRTLDSMEGHPRYYERREIPVLVRDEQYAAWMYFRDPQGVLMHSGDYNEVRSGGV